MTDIFISYSSKDREWVAAFAGLLEARGYTVWWDTSLLAGSDFQRTIRKKLKEAKCVIVVWTEHSVESMWVRAEVDHAARRNVLVPVQLRDAELPMPFNIMHAENFREWQSSPEEVPFQRLLRAVGQHVVIDEVASAEPPRSVKLAATAIEQTEKPVVQAIRQPITPVQSAAETAIEKPAVTSKRKPKQPQAKSKPGNLFQRFGNKLLAAFSAVFVFVLVYALNNTDEVWSWLQWDKAEVVVADKAAQTQELPTLLKGDQEPLSSAFVAKPEQMEKVIELDYGMKLVKIPRGRFQMGSENVTDDEKPVHTVSIDYDFWMSETEITFKQYDAYAIATGKEKPDDEGWGRDSRPVIYVSWNDAQSFVQWLSKNNAKELSCRLPSEAEWEYAARAGTQTDYFWGDQIGKNNANCDGCGSQWDNKQTAPVASFTANEWGLHDMHGNVWEWVQDRWHTNYEGAPADGSAWEEGENGNRVLRGGSWIYTPNYLRSAYRNFLNPGNRFGNIGFRIVCSPPSVR